MQVLPTLAPGTWITDNGHFLVRLTKDSRWEVVDTVTDVVLSTEYDLSVAKALAKARALLAQHALEEDSTND